MLLPLLRLALELVALLIRLNGGGGGGGGGKGAVVLEVAINCGIGGGGGGGILSWGSGGAGGIITVVFTVDVAVAVTVAADTGERLFWAWGDSAIGLSLAFAVLNKSDIGGVELLVPFTVILGLIIIQFY